MQNAKNRRTTDVTLSERQVMSATLRRWRGGKTLKVKDDCCYWLELHFNHSDWRTPAIRFAPSYDWTGCWILNLNCDSGDIGVNVSASGCPWWPVLGESCLSLSLADVFSSQVWHVPLQSEDVLIWTPYTQSKTRQSVAEALLIKLLAEESARVGWESITMNGAPGLTIAIEHIIWISRVMRWWDWEVKFTFVTSLNWLQDGVLVKTISPLFHGEILHLSLHNFPQNSIVNCV